MTALDRAKTFVQKQAAKTALVIIPLAMASTAQATPVTFDVAGASAVPGGSPTGNPGVEVTSGPGTPTPFSALPNGGIRFVGDYTFAVTAPTVGAGSGGTFDLTLLLSGSGSGFFDVLAIPAHYDYTFDLGPGSLFENFTSRVTFRINGAQAFLDDHGTHADRDVLLTWEGEPELTSWSVLLEASFTARGPGDITLHVPTHSIDITPAGDPSVTAVPEPASVALLTTGLGLFAVRRRRLRHRRQ